MIEAISFSTIFIDEATDEDTGAVAKTILVAVLL